jgi:ABC-type antimicrobial peptide transport system permease subunit
LAGIGAALGLATGALATRLIAARSELPYVFDSGNAVLALFLALGINLLSACWPALRAARMDPIAALRHE